MVTILDGGLGAELELRGVPIPRAPWWSARALKEHPAAVQDIHRDYARAGATVHTTNTFRTQRYNIGDEWAPLARKAVELARASIPATHRVAGSIAPIEHCYRPELSPSNAGEYHREVAQLLSDAGVDILLCETFPSLREALEAVEACVATESETWVSFTAGPQQAPLLSPAEVAEGARQAITRGADAVLVNCIPARAALPYVEQLAGLGVPCGIYANGGDAEDGIGWHHDADGVQRYADLAAQWVEAGASIIGGCCGIRPAHIAELSRRFSPSPGRDTDSDQAAAKLHDRLP